MDIGKSFGFVFEDEKWVTKILIGGLISIIPIINFAVIGFALRTMKNVAAGAVRPLPEWDDFGGYFMQGLMTCVASLIYGIPGILVWALMLIIGAIGGGANDSALGGIAGLCVTGLSCVMGLYGLVVGLWLPAALARYAMSGEFGAFFRFGEIWSFISRNVGGYVVALLVYLVAAIIASIVGSILCGIGVLFTTFWSVLVLAYLLGQLEREAGSAVPAPVA